MSVKRVEPDEAAPLLVSGWSYLDARTEDELRVGHPARAYNIAAGHFSGDRSTTCAAASAASDESGAVVVTRWVDRELPVAESPEPGRSCLELLARAKSKE